MLSYQLLRPFAYLRIRHPEKRRIDWILPGVLALLTVLICVWLRPTLVVLGKDGLISSILAFLQNLPGFYIAALAAIAAFGRGSIDEPMPEPTPTVEMRLRGQTNLIELSQRHFLSLLTAFLSVESLILCLISAFGIAFAPTAVAYLPLSFHSAALLVFLIIYFFIFWQLMVATMMGLYYLGDRLHQGKTTFKQPSTSPEGEKK